MAGVARPFAADVARCTRRAAERQTGDPRD